MKYAFVLLVVTICAVGVAADEAAPLTLNWSVGPDPLLAQGGAAVGLIGDHVVVAGGTSWPTLDFKRFYAWTQVYNVKTGVWDMVADLPRELAYGATCSYGGKVYVFGGCGADRKPTAESFVLSATGANADGKPTFAWSAGRPLPEPLVFPMGDRIGSTFYVLGGARDYDLTDISNDLYALDLSTPEGEWRKLAPMPGAPTTYPGFAACGGKLYAFGGYRTDQDPPYNVADAYCYDPATNQWSAIPPMPFAARCPTALAYDDTRLLLFGPYIASAEDVKWHGHDYGASGSAVLYDTTQGTYTPLEPMPRALTTIFFARQGNTLYGVGGELLYKIRSPYLFICEMQEGEEGTR